jgi:uncharacterized membrane protein YccC
VAGSTFRLPALRLPRLALQPANLIFSVNNLIAAALALYISFAADLPRPYWAVLTVYITAQPLTGALRSKAVYRIAGTILGAAAMVAMVPNLVDSPLILSTAIAGWVGLCLYISLLDRTPRSYIFLLSGYTAAFVGFPIVDAPQAAFDTAVARVEEITVGILCATLIHSIFFPREVTVVLHARITAFLGHARAFASAAILGVPDSQEQRERGQLAADMTELKILATHLPFDTSNLRPRQNAVQSLRDRLSLILPLVAAVEDRLGVLRALNALPGNLDALVREVAAYLGNPESSRDEADALIAQCRASVPPLDFAIPETVWPQMVRTSAAVRLGELVEAWRDSLVLAAFVRAPETPPPRIDTLLRQGGRRPLHSDHVLAALSAWAAFAAVLACCLIWILGAWPDGASAALFAAVAASFFAALDDPAPAISLFLFGTIISIPIAAFYLFAVLPAIDGFVMLVIALSPFYLVTGYIQAEPALLLRAMPLILGFTGSIALQETYDANFAAFANSSTALVIGIGIALWSTQLFRSVGAAWSARRIVRAARRDLADLAAGRRFSDRNTWTSLMLDRFGLITPRAKILEAQQDLRTNDVFVDLRAGLCIITLREAGWRPQEVEDMLARLSEAYSARSRDPRFQFAPQILASIDAAIAAFSRTDVHAASPQVCSSLVGLRRTLYPDAPGYQ